MAEMTWTIKTAARQQRILKNCNEKVAARALTFIDLFDVFGCHTTFSLAGS